MKSISKLTALALTLLALADNLCAQTAREQFQTAVTAYQARATEDNARKLAELSKLLNPPPAIPEEAEFRALKGAAFVKQAGDAAAFAKAATEFQAAIAAAPWVGEYHYNLAVCEKSAGRFSAAQTALKFAQILARDDKERRDCLALRASLEAAQELAAAKKAGEQQAAAEAANKKSRGLVGIWKPYVNGRPQRAGSNTGDSRNDYSYRFEMRGEEVTVYSVADTDPIGIDKSKLRRNGGGWAGKGDEDLFARFTLKGTEIKGIFLRLNANTDLTGSFTESEINWVLQEKPTTASNGFTFPGHVTRETLRKQD